MSKINRNTRSGRYHYIYVTSPVKFLKMADGQGYIPEHRLVMAIHLGRPLFRNELVLHIDRNTINNDIHNLKLLRKKLKNKKKRL